MYLDAIESNYSPEKMTSLNLANSEIIYKRIVDALKFQELVLKSKVILQNSKKHITAIWKL